MVTAAGWGLTNPDDRSSDAKKLQKVDLPILPRTKCQDLLEEVNDNMLCAGSLDKFKDAAAVIYVTITISHSVTLIVA